VYVSLIVSSIFLASINKNGQRLCLLSACRQSSHVALSISLVRNNINSHSLQMKVCKCLFSQSFRFCFLSVRSCSVAEGAGPLSSSVGTFTIHKAFVMIRNSSLQDLHRYSFPPGIFVISTPLPAAAPTPPLP